MPRLPRNLHLVATWRSPDKSDNAIRKSTQHDTSKVLRLPLKMTMDTSKVLHLPRKLATHLLKTSQKVLWPATQNDFRHVKSECHEVPRLPRETKQRDVCNFQKWHLLQNVA